MIYVLGAKGFVGSTVLRVLQQTDTCVPIDLDNYDEYVGTSCDVLVNLNGNSKKFLARENPPHEFDLSVRSVVRSLYDFSYSRYVYISSVDVYTDFSSSSATHEDAPISLADQSPYGFHKWLAERYVMKTAPSWLILRLGGMVGPHLAKGPLYDILNDIPLRVHPDSRYQYIHTATIGKIIAHLLAHKHKNDIFNLCANGALQLKTFAHMVQKDCRAEPHAPVEHYDISHQKISQILDVPDSLSEVTRFLTEEGIAHTPIQTA